MRGGVLLVTRNFPPLWGGMERLNWHMAEELARSVPVVVIAPKGARACAPQGVEVHEAPLAPLPRFLTSAAVQTVRQARLWRPAVVLAGSGLTAPVALLAARSARARAAAYVHGLDVAVDHPLYRALWLPCLRRMDAVLANSRATAALAQTAGVASERLSIMPPGVALPHDDEAHCADLATAFRRTHGLEGRRVLITVGRLTERKGVSAFVREALPHIVQAQPEVCLVVVGEPPRAALAARPDPPEAIMAAADTAGLAGRVHLLGNVPDATLTAAWYAADVHVFPVRALPNDPEGFGMVAVEAAAHGVPTVAYATGGVTDAVSTGVSGHLVPPGDARAFARAVIELLDHPLPRLPMQAFAAEFAWGKFGLKVAEAIGLI
ncbi:MAG: glycosyltransferase family 4 protein [Thiobacillaceae bacterium]|nr:glycosyltransferase family 4 protein [Thiobacillaceae bacterium]